MNRVILSAVICAAGLLAHSATAQGYRAEIGAEVVTGEAGSLGYTPPDYTPPSDPGAPPQPPASGAEGGDRDDYDGWAVTGRFYLSDVDTSRGPLDLAPFLSRASHVGGRYGEIEADRSEVETEFWEVFARLVADNGWLVEAGFGAADTDSVLSRDDADLYNLALGYYVARDTQLRVSFDATEGDALDQERYAVDLTHVQQLDSGVTWSVSALLGWVDGDSAPGTDGDGTDVELKASVYLNPQLGMGVDWRRHSRDGAMDGDAYRIWANYFLSEKWVLDLSYVDDDSRGLEDEAVLLEVKYRR